QLSGAVLDPRALLELFPDARKEGFPVEAEVGEDALWVLSRRRKLVLRGLLCPRPFHNRGNWIVSLNKVVKWLAEKAEAEGVEVYPGFGGERFLQDETGRITGVRTVDQGRSRAGQEKANFQPGMDVLAALTVFAEGTRGSLTKALIREKKLDAGCNPQIWSVGIKEIWETKHDLAGKVFHTAGWPLGTEVYGGGWIYGLPGKQVSIGFVMGMDHGDPSFDYHARMQEWKTHPAVRGILDQGTLVRYGAKTIPEGGLFSMPKRFGDGFLLIGDTAGFMNTQRLKGIHLAMKSGMLAAEGARGALAADSCSAESLSRFDRLFQNSWAHEELWKVRNFRQGFQRGFVRGFVRAGFDFLAGGRLPGRKSLQADHELYRRARGKPGHAAPSFDGVLTFDKLTDVFHSGTSHEEDQPCHLVVTDPEICVSRCTEEFGNPCRHFCPAAVYEWNGGGEGLRINASNCVHCKTCDIADPYQVINWVVPGSGGPRYLEM
ncbi:MAG: 4Fe-4S dicluster domain-containing protein, partial [Planctomycetota bacterium]